MELRSNLVNPDAGCTKGGPSSLGPTTPTQLASGKKRGRLDAILLDDLPEEILHHIVRMTNDPGDLCSLASTTRRLRLAVESCGAHWQGLFASLLGDVNEVTKDAAELAGGWKHLYGARCKAHSQVTPWEKVSDFEVQAAVHRMILGVPLTPAPSPKETTGTATPPTAAPPTASTLQDTAIVFLVDGSGSVTQDDFSCMTSFINTTISMLTPLPASQGASSSDSSSSSARAPPAAGTMKNRTTGIQFKNELRTTTVNLGIVQFSNEIRVELELTPANIPNPNPLTAAVDGMQRMNGGTNIAMAVQRAGQMLKTQAPGCRRVIALLTDGRIDSYQAREACEMVGRLADEQGCVSVHCYGVGRGVDRFELLKIISAADEQGAADRYLPLMVLDDAPW